VGLDHAVRLVVLLRLLGLPYRAVMGWDWGVREFELELWQRKVSWIAQGKSMSKDAVIIQRASIVVLLLLSCFLPLPDCPVPAGQPSITERHRPILCCGRCSRACPI